MEKIFDTVEETLAAIVAGEIIKVPVRGDFESLSADGEDRIRVWKDAETGQFEGELSEFFKEAREWEYCYSCDEEHWNFTDYQFRGKARAIDVVREAAEFWSYKPGRWTGFTEAAAFASEVLRHVETVGPLFVKVVKGHLPGIEISEDDPIPREVLEAMHMHGLLPWVDPEDPWDFDTFRS